MTKEEELKAEYERKLQALRYEQSICDHNWGSVIYDPEEISEPVYETRWQGVDCYPALVGSRLIKKDRWSRTCKKCGKIEYTSEKVAVKYEPKFNS